MLGYRDPSRLELHKNLEMPGFLDDPAHGDPQTVGHPPHMELSSMHAASEYTTAWNPAIHTRIVG